MDFCWSFRVEAPKNVEAVSSGHLFYRLGCFLCVRWRCADAGRALAVPAVTGINRLGSAPSQCSLFPFIFRVPQTFPNTRTKELPSPPQSRFWNKQKPPRNGVDLTGFFLRISFPEGSTVELSLISPEENHRAIPTSRKV